MFRGTGTLFPFGSKDRSFLLGQPDGYVISLKKDFRFYVVAHLGSKTAFDLAAAVHTCGQVSACWSHF